MIVMMIQAIVVRITMKKEVGVVLKQQTGIMDDTDTEDRIIPISEWPISCAEPENKLNEENCVTKLPQKLILPSKRDYSDQVVKKDGYEKKRKQHNKCSNTDSDSPVNEEQSDTEPSISAKIARWWRQRKRLGLSVHLPKCNPDSMLYHISRLPECCSFLKKEKERLLSLLQIHCKSANIYAGLASIEDYFGNFLLSLNYIQQALELNPSSKDYQWFQAKISRQCDTLQEQTTAKERLNSNELHFPKIAEIPRVSGNSLSVSEFKELYIKPGKPVIITDVVNNMTKDSFDYSLIVNHAGETRVSTKQTSKDSTTWAKLESSRETSISELVEGIQSGCVKDCLFDWSLPLHCPSLDQLITLPPYFQDNILLQTSPGSLYRHSWPSLFIAPEGAVTQLHVDAFHSHFWMALFQGRKRWTFFDERDTSLLYPQRFQSMDPVFEVDLTHLEVDKFPLLSLTTPQQCELQPGELLFVPAGSPHMVENLTTTLAISSNYVDQSNFDKVCHQLRINSLQDERATDLLSQLEDPAFLKRIQTVCNEGL